MRRLLLLAALTLSSLLWSLTMPGPAGAQDDERDLREATFTAGEILRLAYERKFNAMYDRIHPDAHEIIPRAAAVGVFEEVYAQFDAGEASITGNRLTTWTWGVTGETYERAVEISFEQPYTDASGERQTLEDKMYLVKEGEWRWFFGSSPEFVEAAIERFGGEQGEPLVEGDLVANVGSDLDAFYADVLSYTQFPYESPGFVYVDEGASVRTGCGQAEPGFWAFYCPLDATVYLDAGLMDSIVNDLDLDFAAAFVIAHEWSHHVQTLVSFERVQNGLPNDWNEVYSIELELMADCMSGAWALDVDTRGLLETDDIEEAVTFTLERLGDPGFIDTYDPQAHGSSDQRRQAFLTGYEDGFLGCNIVM